MHEVWMSLSQHGGRPAIEKSFLLAMTTKSGDPSSAWEMRRAVRAAAGGARRANLTYGSTKTSPENIK